MGSTAKRRIVLMSMIHFIYPLSLRLGFHVLGFAAVSNHNSHPQTAQYYSFSYSALGIDSGSPDSGKSLGIDEDFFKVHLMILGNQRIIIENIGAALEKLPPTGYNIHAVPINLYDTCGAPLRLLAFKTPQETSSARTVHVTSMLAFLSILIFFL